MGGRTRAPYPLEYKADLVRLVREEGRSQSELAREFEPSAQSIMNWVAQAEIDDGRRGGLTTDEKAELRRLRAENWMLRVEKDLLEEQRPSSQRRTPRRGKGVRVHLGGEGQPPGQVHVRAARRDPRRLLRVAHYRRGLHRGHREDPCQLAGQPRHAADIRCGRRRIAGPMPQARASPVVTTARSMRWPLRLAACR